MELNNREIVVLKNEELTVRIRHMGGELTSIVDSDGRERLWQGNPEVWKGQAPTLFPLIGRLAQGRYTLNGAEYEIPTHGFARNSLFQVTSCTDTSVTLSLTDTDQTRAVYPFAFLFEITYRLNGNRIEKVCRVENRGDTEMHYEVGGHDGYCVPLSEGEKMADYAITIEGLDEMRPYGTDENVMITPKDAVIALDGGHISIIPAVSYGLDTVILDDLPTRRAELVDGAGRVRLAVEFPDFPYLALWTADKPVETGYICIEPWSALPDATFVGRGLADKKGIRSLASGASEALCYTTIIYG